LVLKLTSFFCKRGVFVCDTGELLIYFQNGLAQLSSRLMIEISARCSGSVSSCLIANLPQVTGKRQFAGPKRGRMVISKNKRSFFIGQVRRSKNFLIIN